MSPLRKSIEKPSLVVVVATSSARLHNTPNSASKTQMWSQERSVPSPDLHDRSDSIVRLPFLWPIRSKGSFSTHAAGLLLVLVILEIVVTPTMPGSPNLPGPLVHGDPLLVGEELLHDLVGD